MTVASTRNIILCDNTIYCHNITEVGEIIKVGINEIGKLF